MKMKISGTIINNARLIKANFLLIVMNCEWTKLYIAQQQQQCCADTSELINLHKNFGRNIILISLQVLYFVKGKIFLAQIFQFRTFNWILYLLDSAAWSAKKVSLRKFKILFSMPESYVVVSCHFRFSNKQL